MLIGDVDSHSNLFSVICASFSHNYHSQRLFSLASSAEAVADLNAAYPALSTTLDNAFASNVVLPSVSVLLASAPPQEAYGDANNDAMLSLEQVNCEFAELSVGQSAVDNARISRALTAALPRGMTAVKYLLEAHYSHVGRIATTASAADAANSTITAVGAPATSVVVLGKIVTEGDNIPDGLQLAMQVLDIFALYKSIGAVGAHNGVTLAQLSHPASWRNKFGRGISGQAVNMFM